MKKEQRPIHLVTLEEKVVLFARLWIQYKKKKRKEKKEVLEVLIHLS